MGSPLPFARIMNGAGRLKYAAVRTFIPFAASRRGCDSNKCRTIGSETQRHRPNEPSRFEVLFFLATCVVWKTNGDPVIWRWYCSTKRDAKYVITSVRSEENSGKGMSRSVGQFMCLRSAKFEHFGTSKYTRGRTNVRISNIAFISRRFQHIPRRIPKE